MGEIGKTTQNLSVNLRAELVEALGVAADLRGVSRNALVKEILEERLADPAFLDSLQDEMERRKGALERLRKSYGQEITPALRVAEKTEPTKK